MIVEHQLLPYSLSEIPRGPYLVFAPHPDDETFGMGGTICLAVQAGINVYVAFITNGDMGGDPEVRKKESDAALKILGVKKIFYFNLPDRKVLISQFPEKKLNDIMDEIQPLTIFLPSFQEIHPDHRAATHKVLSFLNNKNYSLDLWFYEINRQGEVNRLIDITSVVDIKEEAMECYKSQLEQIDYNSHTLCLDFARSITLGRDVMYAEGFWHYDSGSCMTPENEYFNKLEKYKIGECNSGCPNSGCPVKSKRLKNLISFKSTLQSIKECIQFLIGKFA